MKHIRAKVAKNEKENVQVSLLTLDISIPAEPGQFVMAWIPGEDEKPMSVAGASPLQLAIANVGKASGRLAGMKEGEYIFVRGPYGKGFRQKGKKWLMVGGGYGFAPLRFLAKEGEKSGADVSSIIGARSKDYLMAKASGKNYITTDDGSAGKKGNVLAELEPLLEKEKFSCIYCCGPEKMMKAVAQAAKKHNVPCQLSVERYMKCGFGVCGHCAMGGWLSCIDGPTIDGEEALKNKEFGNLACDRAGRKTKI